MGRSLLLVLALCAGVGSLWFFAGPGRRAGTIAHSPPKAGTARAEDVEDDQPSPAASPSNTAADQAREPTGDVHPYEPSQGEPDIPIEVGPTYRIETRLPDDHELEDFQVQLVLDPPRVGLELEDAPDRATRLRRDEHGYWARFRAQTTSRDSPWWLALASEDGLWSGGARVQSVEGIYPEPVRIELHPCCAVRGRFDPPGGPYERGAMIALERLDCVPPAIAWSHVDLAGEFRVAALAPARYRLEVRDPAFVAPPLEFELAEGELDLGVLAWTPLTIAGSVRVVAESATELSLDVELVRTLQTPRHPDFHSDSWVEIAPGRFESEFVFEEVFEGDYELRVHTHQEPPWHGIPVGVRPPQTEVRIRLPEPVRALRIEAYDGRSGATIEGASLSALDEHGAEEFGMTPLVLEGVVVEEELPVVLWEPGHRAVRTSFRELLAMERTEDGAIRVALVPGWSGALLAILRGTGERVPGVEAWLDGALAGRTDEQGLVWIDREFAPREVELRHPDFVCTPWDTDWEDEAFHWIRVWPR